MDENPTTSSQLSPDELERYARQLGPGVLSAEGQMRLKESTALVALCMVKVVYEELQERLGDGAAQDQEFQLARARKKKKKRPSKATLYEERAF